MLTGRRYRRRFDSTYCQPDSLLLVCIACRIVLFWDEVALDVIDKVFSTQDPDYSLQCGVLDLGVSFSDLLTESP